MDAALTTLFTNLVTIASKPIAADAANRIKAIGAKKNDKEAIQELTTLVNELIQSYNEILSIALALKEKLVAQQISDNEINYIVDTIMPKLENILQSEKGLAKSAETIEQIKPVLSQDTLKVLQTLGFNYRQAIGEPLTQVMRDLILSKMRPDNRELELKILQEQNHNTYLALGEKEDYSDRLEKIQETYKTFHD